MLATVHPTQTQIRRAKELRRDTTDAEKKLWYRLRRQGLDFRFRRQVPIGNYIADFASHAARLVVEVDGGQHGSDEAEARDRLRTEELSKCGYRVIRFWNFEVLEELDNVVERIWSELHEVGDLSRPLPNPPPERGRG